MNRGYVPVDWWKTDTYFYGRYKADGTVRCVMALKISRGYDREKLGKALAMLRDDVEEQCAAQ